MKYKGSFRNLVVWQQSKELCKRIYSETASFPTEEKYGLSSQLRRASSSIMANIAEGNNRKTPKDKAKFFNIALASLTETDCVLELSFELNYINEESHKNDVNLLNKTAYLLWKLTTAVNQLS